MLLSSYWRPFQGPQGVNSFEGISFLVLNCTYTLLKLMCLRESVVGHFFLPVSCIIITLLLSHKRCPIFHPSQSLKKNYLFVFREVKGGREGEKQQCVVACGAPPTGDLTHNSGMCPDWESNWWPFDMQSGTQSTEPHQSAKLTMIYCPRVKYLGHKIKQQHYFWRGDPWKQGQKYWKILKW